MTSPEMPLDRPGLRSLLFAPGNHARRAVRVFESGADAAILDLEDAVPPGAKVAARASVVAALRQPRACAGYVRINSLATPWCYGDLVAVVTAGTDGIVLPKAESGEQLRTLDWLIGNLERERGLPAGAIDLLPLVETARGIMALEGICGASPRVRRVAFGGGDYTLDLGLQWTAAEDELAYARARLVHCARVAGIEPPIDTVLLQLRDGERFRASAARARQMGFQGKLCIHPDQVPIANEAFAPTGAEIARARAVVAAFEAAEERGSASLEVDGQFVDYPVLHAARRTLALAGRGAGAALTPPAACAPAPATPES
jgi:citrate lyase subunit beta/citryl-CoA lyase